MNNRLRQRRRFIKSSAFGLIGITTLGYSYAQHPVTNRINPANSEPHFYRYPGMNNNMVSSIVGAAHSNFDKVKELVTQRPELAGAAWGTGVLVIGKLHWVLLLMWAVVI